MPTTTSSPFLAPPRFSTQIAGSPIASAPGSAPILRIRCLGRFEASSCEVSLIPARFPRPLPRRQNALRDKVSPFWPPPVVPHQVRRPSDEPPKLESLDGQEPKSGCLDTEPSSDLNEKLEIYGALGASRSGNLGSKSKLDGEKNATGVTGEEITFCKTGAGPVYEGRNVVRIEVDEDEIMNRSEPAVGVGGVDSECMLSRARVIATEPKRGKRVAPKNSSPYQFAAADQVESPVLNGEVSVAQRNATPLRSVTRSGLAALCGVCLVFALSKLIQTNSKAHLLKRLTYMHRPGVGWVELNKGNMTMLKSAHGFSGGLLRRPHLERKELMNNIKQAKDSREWFIIINSFSCKTAINGDDATIAEIRRTVTGTSIKEKIGVVFPHLVASEEAVSSVYGNQSDFDGVPHSSRSSGFSLSSDKIEETVEKTVDIKKGAAVTNTGVKDGDNIGEIELPEPAYDHDRATGANERTSDVKTSEKESQIGSDYHNLDPNRINRTSCGLESEEEYAEICAKNVDGIQGTKSSMPCISDQQIMYAKDNAHESSINILSETADGFLSDCFDISSSELRNNKTLMDINVSDVSAIQEVRVPRISAKDAQTAHCKEFDHNMNIIDEEACKTPIMTGTVTATSLHGSSKEPIDLKRDNMRLVQEPKPSISTRNDDKQASHVNEKEHRERTIQKEAQAQLETENTGILDGACTSSIYAPQEETVQHKFSKRSTSEKKQEKRTSSNKKARVHLSKNKGKLQKQVCSNKEEETKKSEQAVSGTNTVNDPSNCLQKTKRLAKKRLKEVQSDMQRVATEDDVQSRTDDQKNNSQNIKKSRRNMKNASRDQEAQTKDENLEITREVGSPYNSPTDNVKPLAVADSSAQTKGSKDAFIKDQPNGSSVSKMTKR